MSAAISSHFLSFYRLANNRNWVKASCSCGWVAEGKPAEVYGKAACHDLDIEPPKHENIMDVFNRSVGKHR